MLPVASRAETSSPSPLTERKTVMSPSIFRSKMKNKIEKKKRKKGEDRLADKSCDERVWNT